MSKVCQLFSGSSGNSILVSSKGCNVLVDIGVSAKRCENALRDINFDPASISAILVTHEHIDHVSGVRVFASRYNIPVFASAKCIAKMYDSGAVNDSVDIRSVDGEIDLGDVTAQSFHLSHDSDDCLGYRLFLSDSRSVSVCTDTGFVTDEAREKLLGTDLVFLESNHETSMVQTGSYPYILKQRILGAEGHLSNFACGEFAVELAKSGTTRFVLSHLSRENNTPELAHQATLSALTQSGFEEERDFKLWVSPQINESRAIVL